MTRTPPLQRTVDIECFETNGSTSTSIRSPTSHLMAFTELAVRIRCQLARKHRWFIVCFWVALIDSHPVLAQSEPPSPTPLSSTAPATVPTPPVLLPDATLPQATPAPVGSSPAATSQSNDSVVDEIERLLRQRENAEAAAAAQMPPGQPRTHRFTNQPISRVLRILAEQAGINYIEPNIPGDERISVTLTNLTPFKAFYQIAQSRGFEVLGDGKKYTLRRSDIASPSFYVTRRYPIQNQSAEFLLESIGNYLGIKVNQAAPNHPAYPKPADTNITQDVSSSLGGTGGDQSRPRYQPGLPFDAPLSTGGFSKNSQNAIFVERSSNSLVVRATPEDHVLIAAEIRRLDKSERQIMIKTYVIEVVNNRSKGFGADWSQALGFGQGQGIKFSLSGKADTTTGGASQLNPISYFSNGLVLKMSDVNVVIQALKTQGRVKANNTPMTVAKSGMPVTIRSATKQTIFIQTPGTQLYGPSSNPYTFTTGLTIDVVARILDHGLVDMSLNPTLSSQISTSDAQPGSNTQVPVISTRSATANVTIRSGEAAVIGGILQDNSSINMNAIPGLSRIPVVGYLFKTRSHNHNRSNLIVVVSPTIISAASHRRDRLGKGEASILQESADLPGEPPPMPIDESGKPIKPFSVND
jgi:type II secretory pathway component GspD/PulD (secretin)